MYVIVDIHFSLFCYLSLILYFCYFYLYLNDFICEIKDCSRKFPMRIVFFFPRFLSSLLAVCVCMYVFTRSLFYLSCSIQSFCGCCTRAFALLSLLIMLLSLFYQCKLLKRPIEFSETRVNIQYSPLEHFYRLWRDMHSDYFGIVRFCFVLLMAFVMRLEKRAKI